MSFLVEDAVRTKQVLRLALTGTSGSGKTLTALKIARGMATAIDPNAGKEAIVLIDTERGSASLYAKQVPFRTIDFRPPYKLSRYREALDAAEAAMPLVVIVDQISHAWAGEGGLLETVEALKASSRNAFTDAWGKATPEQNKFVERLLACQCHLIVTMRSKSEYVLEERTNRAGNKVQVPKKVGLKPIQRDGVEYEFTSVLDLSLEHYATSTKDRTGLFDSESPGILDENTGKELIEWLSDGAPVVENTYVKDPEPEIVPPEERAAVEASPPSDGFGDDDPERMVTEDDWKTLIAAAHKRGQQIGVDGKRIQEVVLAECNATRPSQLTISQFADAMDLVRHFKAEDA